MTQADEWRPSSGPLVAQSRAFMLSAARHYFAKHDVMEVETPMLSRYAVTDVNIESINAQLAAGHGTDFFLRTSPEFAMKRLLAAGYPDIYEIGRVFRDDEAGRHHQPEFTMIEWYRLGLGINEIIDDTLGLIQAMLQPDRFGNTPRQLSYRQAFHDCTGLDPLDAPLTALADAANADRKLRDSIGDSRDEWLDLLMAIKVSRSFASDRLTVIHHYPASQAALARICPEDSRYADRFEVFHGHMELANGYVELIDGNEQANRFEADQLARKRRGQVIRPHDQQLLAALNHGLPPCSGVAMGLDRLLMVNEQIDDIRKVASFAFQESNDE